jgi:Mg2+ and Co2+ transporter CorA
VAFLVWGLLDYAVDGHFDAVEGLDAEIESLEDLLFDEQPHDVEVQRRSFQLMSLTIQSNRLNLIMKKVTSWAAIIAVPTAVTGFYGQNVPYPGFSAHSGFWISTTLIVALSGSLYWSFRRRDWI